MLARRQQGSAVLRNKYRRERIVWTLVRCDDIGTVGIQGEQAAPIMQDEAITRDRDPRPEGRGQQ